MLHKKHNYWWSASQWFCFVSCFYSLLLILQRKNICNYVRITTNNARRTHFMKAYTYNIFPFVPFCASYTIKLNKLCFIHYPLFCIPIQMNTEANAIPTKKKRLRLFNIQIRRKYFFGSMRVPYYEWVCQWFVSRNILNIENVGGLPYLCHRFTLTLSNDSCKMHNCLFKGGEFI